MSNKGLEFWNTLPTWAKGVLAVGGATAIYFTAKSILNRIKKQSELKNQLETQKTQKAELDELIKNGVSPSFPASQYKQWADELQSQFDGCDVNIKGSIWLPNWFMDVVSSGSAKKLASIVDKFKNDADYLALSTAWGASRTYDQCGWGTGDFSGNLSQAVTDELSENEIKVINDYISKKGIRYRFA